MEAKDQGEKASNDAGNVAEERLEGPSRKRAQLSFAAAHVPAGKLMVAEHRKLLVCFAALISFLLLLLALVMGYLISREQTGQEGKEGEARSAVSVLPGVVPRSPGRPR